MTITHEEKMINRKHRELGEIDHKISLTFLRAHAEICSYRYGDNIWMRDCYETEEKAFDNNESVEMRMVCASNNMYVENYDYEFEVSNELFNLLATKYEPHDIADILNRLVEFTHPEANLSNFMEFIESVPAELSKFILYDVAEYSNQNVIDRVAMIRDLISENIDPTPVLQILQSAPMLSFEDIKQALQSKSTLQKSKKWKV